MKYLVTQLRNHFENLGSNQTKNGLKPDLNCKTNRHISMSYSLWIMFMFKLFLMKALLLHIPTFYTQQDRKQLAWLHTDAESMVRFLSWFNFTIIIQDIPIISFMPFCVFTDAKLLVVSIYRCQIISCKILIIDNNTLFTHMTVMILMTSCYQVKQQYLFTFTWTITIHTW